MRNANLEMLRNLDLDQLDNVTGGRAIAGDPGAPKDSSSGPWYLPPSKPTQYPHFSPKKEPPLQAPGIIAGGGSYTLPVFPGIRKHP